MILSNFLFYLFVFDMAHIHRVHKSKMSIAMSSPHLAFVAITLCFGIAAATTIKKLHSIQMWISNSSVNVVNELQIIRYSPYTYMQNTLGADLFLQIECIKTLI